MHRKRDEANTLLNPKFPFTRSNKLEIITGPTRSRSLEYYFDMCAKRFNTPLGLRLINRSINRTLNASYPKMY